MKGLHNRVKKSKKKSGKRGDKTSARKLAKAQNFRCARCKQKIIQDFQYEIDNIDGNKRNRDFTNLQVLCLDCHRKKSIRQTRLRKNATRR